MLEKYLKEVHSSELIRVQYGFAAIQIQKESLFVQDIYIEKEFRKNRHGSKLIEILEQEARKHDKQYLTGFVGRHNNSEGVLGLAFLNGWKISEFTDRGVFIMKEVPKRG